MNVSTAPFSHSTGAERYSYRRFGSKKLMAVQNGSELTSPRASRLHRYSSKTFDDMEGVLALEWVQQLMSKDDTSSVITAGAMVAADSKLPADHMVGFKPMKYSFA